MAKKPAIDNRITTKMEEIYTTNPDAGGSSSVENWYKQKPYAFVLSRRTGEVDTFYLPISPSNLNITTHFATNVISTMYGTVEEHSEQRYYDITIAGTTGMMPRYYRPIGYQKIPSGGRAGYAVKDSLSNAAGGFFKRTLSVVNKALNSVSALLGEPAPSTGVSLDATGYVAFHNFYKFLLTYKKDASGESSTRIRGGHPFKFINYKDNNEYDVAIQGFTLTRDASNPMLYNYNLTMRAYNLRKVTANKIVADVADRAVALGLDDVNNESVFAIMANKARQAKNAGYAAIAAAKGFGS